MTVPINTSPPPSSRIRQRAHVVPMVRTETPQQPVPIDGGLPQNQLARAIAQRHMNRLRWDSDTGQWCMKQGNIWQPVQEIDAHETIMHELDRALDREGYSHAKLTAIEKFMRVETRIRGFETSRHLSTHGKRCVELANPYTGTLREPPV